MTKRQHSGFGFSIRAERAVPFVIIIGLVAADALTIIAITAAA
ncbi:MAG: hypothetical protein NXH78_15210 [Hyphomonadaceae bacterium]|nr:hypothetical protein [Hyphomonadaceae bacterium]